MLEKKKPIFFREYECPKCAARGKDVKFKWEKWEDDFEIEVMYVFCERCGYDEMYHLDATGE